LRVKRASGNDLHISAQTLLTATLHASARAARQATVAVCWFGAMDIRLHCRLILLIACEDEPFTVAYALQPGLVSVVMRYSNAKFDASQCLQFITLTFHRRNENEERPNLIHAFVEMATNYHLENAQFDLPDAKVDI